MKKFLPLLVVALFVALVKLAQAASPVLSDQGKPGNQGPWPVTFAGSITDGGSEESVLPGPCSVLVEANTSVGAAAAIVPATPAVGRIWIRICNSGLNTSTAQCICSATSVPTFAASSLGDFLATTDCVTFNMTSQDAGVPQCICNGAGTRLTSLECKP